MNKTKQFKIETPIATIESDSGNHLYDVFSVLIVFVIAYILKRMFIGKKWLI